MKQQRWKLTAHILSRSKNDCNITMTWAPEGRRRGGVQWRNKGVKGAGNLEFRYKEQQHTERNGDAL